MKKKGILLLLFLVLMGLVLSCGKNTEEPEEEEVIVEEETEEEGEEENLHEGMARSLLTGEWIDEELAAKRPYAVMIGNTSDALPQYGLSAADVIYEVPVEGSYTRLLAIFQDISQVEKIGSIRSSRHYFIYFALEFDAIYVHYGQTVYAKTLLNQGIVNNISSLSSTIESLAFYRDSDRVAPHNVFTTESGLLAATEKKEYRTTYSDTYTGHYQFAEDEEPVLLEEGTDALVVQPGYFVNKPWFVYNETDGLYYRYEFKAAQIDGSNQEQLAVKNIIIQYWSGEYAYENGYLDIDTTGTGTGKYITNGKMIDITWEKSSTDDIARYYDAEGNEITLNQGKTWVCIMRDSYVSRFAVYASVEEM